MKITVVDWGDETYRLHGKPTILAEFVVDKYLGFSYDGGRLDFNAYPDTIWVFSHQWSVYVDYDYNPEDYFVEVKEED